MQTIIYRLHGARLAARLRHYSDMTQDLRALALDVIRVRDPNEKALAARALDPHAPCDPDRTYEEPAGVPGRLERPPLVPPAELKQRSVHTLPGRIALIHALAHIELNAINLALDAVWRFAGMPDLYYRHWLRVAQEEALHYQLLREHLVGLGADYGDLPAHDALWEMAEKTKDDLLARMALVPRTLEARGLDAAPLIQVKLRKAGDQRAVEILDVILRDEVGHVAIGNHWFRHLCTQRGLEPVATYATLARQYGAPRLRGPFNLEARRAAGFDQAELDALDDA